MEIRWSFSNFFFYTFVLAVLVMAVTGAWLFFTARTLPDVAVLRDPTASFSIQAPDWQGRYQSFTVGPQNPEWVPLQEIPRNLRNAVLAGEDFSFYGHNGVDWYEIYQSFKKNLRERRFARGASTITQQLAKNLFLSREKSIERKVKELILARRLEKTLTKDRILELYLNVVELGDMVYGVGAGARHHFGKRPSELTLRESSVLAAMLPGPKVYDPVRDPDRVMNRSDHLLGVMLKGRWISEEEYLEALNELPYAADPQKADTTLPVGEPEPELTIDQEKGTVSDEAEAPPGEEPALELEGLDAHKGIIEIPIGD